MLQFSLTSIARADLWTTYSTVCRPESYPDLIPDLYPSVRVLSVRGPMSVAEEHIVLGGRELVIMARHVAQSPHMHETFIIGGDAKGSHIIHALEDAKPEHRTGAPAPSTRITTTVRLRAGRLGYLSRVRLGSMDAIRESFANIITGLVRAAEDQKETAKNDGT